MTLSELVAYALILGAIALAVGGIWAARYHSPWRRYARLRAKERRKARDRAGMAEGSREK